ncbi:MAG TPA: erythromycin biosynthesis sensory transduction protein eryC1 [Solibacterales bacterium]|nr:erythromycin biosynthesis sensory transduction protein eryC1 [Bryobacterales bacterium]
MTIPAVNLKPALQATEAAWRARLDELFHRMQFILGEQLASFEREFAAALGSRFAIGAGSGTSAIELSLRHAGIVRSNQEVLTTPLTAPFTGIGILGAGASIRFADIDPDTLLLDPAKAAARITKRTAALLPVHLYGQPCPLDQFSRLAKDAGAELLQDACQAHGARYRGRPLTAYSRYVAYSFYPTKNLGCLGDGGAVATNSATVDRGLRLLRDGGRRNDQLSRIAGANSRLDEMQCCYLRAFLPKLEEWNAWRARIAALYDDLLRDCPGVRLLKRWPCSVHHLYVIRVKRRERLRAHLAAQGIGTGAHYPVPLHLHPAFAGSGARRGDLPEAERAAREVLSLPLWPYLPPRDAIRVAETIRSFFAP